MRGNGLSGYALIRPQAGTLFTHAMASQNAKWKCESLITALGTLVPVSITR